MNIIAISDIIVVPCSPLRLQVQWLSLHIAEPAQCPGGLLCQIKTFKLYYTYYVTIMSYYVTIMSIKTFTIFGLLCHYVMCQKSTIISIMSLLLCQLFFLSILCQLCQLKLDYVTYFKSDLLYQLFISTVIIPIIFFDAIKTII